MFRRVLIPMFVAFLATPSVAFATPDSFFDIFVDVSETEAQCLICDSIEADIADKQDAIATIKSDIAEVEAALESTNNAQEVLQKALEEVQAELQELSDPQNYVESEGRRYDSADHSAMQRRSSELWDAYKEGDLTAQEYSDEVGKDFDDPDVQRDLEKIKKDIARELQDTIEEIKEQLRDILEEREALNAIAAALTAELDACLTELEELLNALAECTAQCQQGPVRPQDFGVTPESRSVIDSFFDLFRGPPPILPDPNFAEEHDEDDMDDIPVELFEMPLQGLEPITVLPNSKCQHCDPLRAEIAAKEAELALLDAEMAQTMHGITVYETIIEQAERYKGNLEASLEKLSNPTDYVESDGRRYDSSDHSAMQVRNQRLWSAYKHGQLSAAELEAEWAKDFDDADVQKELDEIKEELRDELNDNLDDINEGLKEATAEKKQLEAEVAHMKQMRTDCEATLAAMYAELKECEKRCKETADAVEFIQDLLKDEPSIWEDPTEDFVIPLPDPTDDADACMSSRECESNCVPEGKACVEISREGKTCFACSDNNDCKEPAVNLKVCEERCDGSCNRDQSAGPACFNCSGCLDPTMSRRACEQTCVPEGGACVQDASGGKSCFTCDMENPCKKPAMNLKECEEQCGSCERNEEAGAACFDCNDAKSDEDDADDDMGFMCSWFGVWCPKEPVLTLRDAIACVNEGQGSRCDTFDHNDDGTVDLDDLSQWTPTLVGPGGIDFPLQINGMDGNDDLSIDDFSQLSDCLAGGPQNCAGLLFGQPGNDVLFDEDTVGLGGNDFRPQLINGSDILLGDPLNPDLIAIGGGRDDILGGGEDSLLGGPGDALFGPGNDPFSGPLGGAGVDVLGAGGNDLVGPPPTISEPNMANDPQVREVVQAAVRRYLQSNPLGPCEKLEVTVRRVRIGNRVRYTVTIKRVQDESLCPPSADPLNDPEIFQDGFESGDTTRWTTNDEEADEPDDDLCEDVDCDDGDECTQDECDSETGECTNTPIEGCGEEESKECPDIAHANYDACKTVCSHGTCREMSDFDGCYVCQPDELRCPSSMSKSISECQRSCDGKCIENDTGCWDCIVKPTEEHCPQGTDIEAEGPYCSRCESAECTTLKVLSSGTYCLQCIAPKPQECDSPTMTEGACRNSCDGTCTKSYTRDDGVKCFDCRVEEIEEEEEEEEIEEETEEEVRCPSGTTSDESSCESQCPADGVCLEEDGCFSCVVVNCPEGTFRNECPSDCSNGCSVVGQQHGVSCYQCKQDCRDVCAENGYGPEDTDHSNAILSELNGYSCVFGAHISIQTATIGDCRCVGEYSLNVDTTPPVCAGTPCGDVECGGSASCPGGPNETITVNCNWGGWEKIQKHQFRPVIGN